MPTTDVKIFCLSCKDPRYVFVFGANERGAHGRGAAAHAKQYHKAKNGVGYGLQGNSFGIPTKDSKIKTLPLSKIGKYVADFIRFAEENKEMEFFVTAIGTGLAGYSHEQIAPMFKDAPYNCVLPERWKEIISKLHDEEKRK